jgi:hypothetical protein
MTRSTNPNTNINFFWMLTDRWRRHSLSASTAVLQPPSVIVKTLPPAKVRKRFPARRF